MADLRAKVEGILHDLLAYADCAAEEVPGKATQILALIDEAAQDAVRDTLRRERE